MKNKPVIFSVVGTVVVIAIVMFLATPKNKGESSLSVENATDSDATVFIEFGADSVFLPSDTTFCAQPSPDAKLNCSFKIEKNSSRKFELDGKHFNGTFAINSNVGCGSTKAEININNPKWYNVVDISLVDGYSNNLAINISEPSTSTVIGPPVCKDKECKTGNEKVFGLYPLGCDICSGRSNPTCPNVGRGDNIGCHSGTQFNPNPPCQWQGSVMGGAGSFVVSLVKMW